MNQESNEIEMQMYAFRYGEGTSFPTTRPYYWDGESDLPEEVPDFLAEEYKPASRPSIFSDDEMELGSPDEPLPKNETVPADAPMMEHPAANDCEAAFSLGSQSTEGACSLNTGTFPNPIPSPNDKIDQQLDFILESIRKQKKKTKPQEPKPPKTKRLRTRKTSAQLEFLQSELQEGEVLDKQKMKSLAETTGLSESQVYKWFWDHRRKKEQTAC